MRSIGLDIGGTSIKGAVIEGETILRQVKNPTNAKQGRDAILDAIFSTIDALLPDLGPGGRIGIGCAGDIDPYEGKVIFATGNLPNFTGLPLKALVEERFGVPVTVVNDAVSGLIGELAYGAGKGMDHVVLLTLGTGLGGGIAIGGRLLLGANCRGARLGHITLHPGGRPCNCGRAGCAEQYVSATGLTKTALEYGVTQTDCTEIFRLAHEGDPKAAEAVHAFFTDLGRVIDTVVQVFDPECVILGGGLVESREYWWESMLQQLEEKQRALVVPARLGNRAGFFGSQYAAAHPELF